MSVYSFVQGEIQFPSNKSFRDATSLLKYAEYIGNANRRIQWLDESNEAIESVESVINELHRSITVTPHVNRNIGRFLDKVLESASTGTYVEVVTDGVIELFAWCNGQSFFYQGAELLGLIDPDPIDIDLFSNTMSVDELESKHDIDYQETLDELMYDIAASVLNNLKKSGHPKGMGH